MAEMIETYLGNFRKDFAGSGVDTLPSRGRIPRTSASPTNTRVTLDADAHPSTRMCEGTSEAQVSTTGEQKGYWRRLSDGLADHEIDMEVLPRVEPRVLRTFITHIALQITQVMKAENREREKAVKQHENFMKNFSSDEIFGLDEKAERARLGAGGRRPRSLVCTRATLPC